VGSAVLLSMLLVDAEAVVNGRNGDRDPRDVNDDGANCLCTHCTNFALAFAGDVDGDSLLQEIMDCRMPFRSRPS
jgi:hypothetical protein